MSEEKKKHFVSRRAFLKAASAAGMAGATGGFLASCKQPAPEEVVVDEPVQEIAQYTFTPEPVPETKFNFCGVCGPNCGMIAHVVDGKVVALKGNPVDQCAQGKLCVKGYSAVKDLYDPDRLKFPLKRTNPDKGPGVDPGFVQISWDEAFELAGTSYKKAIEENGPESVVIFSRGHDWLNRWQKAMGTPNCLSHNSICYTTYDAPWNACVGVSGRPWTLDLGNAKYLLSFGWDQPSKAKNNQAREYIKALENGAKAVVINPRLTITGSLADEWIPIKPGTDLAFCLAMMNIIINEELYDKDFVDNYTDGIEKLKEGVQDYTAEWAAEMTGIDAATIERITLEFATTKPAMIPNHKRDAGGPNHANSWRVAFSTLILNALVGSIDREGGQIIQKTPKMPSFDEVFPPDESWFPEMTNARIDGYEKHKFVAKKQSGDFATCIDGIINEDPYPVKAAFIRKYNVLAFPNAHRAVEALKKFDFVAVCEIMPSEMAMMADVVFPEPHFLETSGMGERKYQALYPQIHLRQAVHDPLYDTKGFGSIVTGVAKAMGMGQIFEDVSSGTFNDERLTSLGSSWDELQASQDGVWSDEKPLKGQTEFKTESGKIEIYANQFEAAGYDPIPYWQPKKELPSEEYPFYFLITRAPMHKMTQSQNNELVMQLNEENSIMMNHEKAMEMGIQDGDVVIAESRAGKIRLKAELVNGLRPDCVSVDHGFGHWSKDLTRAYNVGANDGDLIPDVPIAEMLANNDPGAGGMMNDFCVKISKA